MGSRKVIFVIRGLRGDLSRCRDRCHMLSVALVILSVVCVSMGAVILTSWY